MAIIKSGADTSLWTVDPISKAGRITLYDAAGHPVYFVLGGDGNYYLGASVEQNVEISTLNSSVAQINAGATWSGASESSLGIAGIQVNSFLDKQHTVTVFQSMDGTNWDISDAHDVPANYGVSRTVQAVAAFYKVTVKNTTAANSTVCRIQTANCPIVEALPRSLTTGGNLKVTPSAEWQNNRLTTGLYALSSFRTLGDTNATQNIFSLENPAASTIMIAVRGLSVVTDSTAALATLAPQMRTSRTTGLPTGGTVLVPTKFRTSYPTCQAIPRGATASDGGGATAITATPGNILWAQFIDRLHTAVGWITHDRYDMLPDVGADLRQILLLPGEAILIQSATAMAATTHISVNCSWLELAFV
jgi:hypothetical protein